MGTMDKGTTQGREAISGNGAMQGTAQENEQLVRRMFSALNEHDANKVLPYLTENHRLIHMPFNETFQGHDGFKKYLNNWIRSFPDYKLDLTNVVATPNKVMCEYTARGTHTGTLNTPMGDIPATNKRVEMKLVDAYEITNGRISVARSYFDTADMMKQLGLGTKH